MLPRETSLRQLKMLRKLTKGTDIGDITKDDRLNHNVPNLQYIGNPIDTGIDSYEDFTEKDNELQTIAFKSKLVNKPIVKENNKEKMENNIISFNEYNKSDFIEQKMGDVIDDGIDDEGLDIDYIKHKKKNDKIRKFEESLDNLMEPNDKELTITKRRDPKNDYENRDIEPGYYEEYPDDSSIINGFDAYDNEDDDFENELEDEELEDEELEDEELEDELDKEFNNIQNYESFNKIKESKEFELLGKEKEPKSNPNFGYAAVRDQEIKKIAFFDNFPIDPKTPKERPIGGAAGQFIDNGEVKGIINRIEGKNVYVESVDNPMVIKKFNIKDVVKTKKD
jgi:hypothetical protein